MIKDLPNHYYLTSIKELVQIHQEDRVEPLRADAMKALPSLNNAFLEVKDGRIENFGSMSQFLPDTNVPSFSCEGKMVLPGFTDSHTHLVFAGSRESEFVDKIKGLSYAEIAAKGGGILNSARLLQSTEEEDLLHQSRKRLEEVLSLGTVALEIKSGYGLSKEAELKMLKVARQLEKEYPICIKRSFLGAHAVPQGRSKEEYLKEVLNSMLPQVADESLADYVDIFCEKGFFTVDDTERLIEVGKQYGLKAKIHANQLHLSGGVQVGVKHGIVSVDHLETVGEEEIELLASSDTIATLLPGAAFFLRMSMPPARELIERGAIVSLASDFNPGSCPSGNLWLMMSLACVQMKMTPEEAINALTLNAAHALELADEYGSIAKGKWASLIITKPVPSLAFLPYAFGSIHVEQVLLKGKVFEK